MKKRIVAVMLSMVVCFSIVGCSKSASENNNNENAEVVSEDQVEDQVEDQAEDQTGEVELKESTDPKAETTLSNGTIEVSLFDDANEAFKKLGESTEEDVFGNIIYDDFSVQCYGEGDDMELSGIFTYSENVKTSKGISVGASYDDVVAAYGEPSFESEEDGNKVLNYTYSEYTLSFTMDNDKVASIAFTVGLG